MEENLSDAKQMPFEEWDKLPIEVYEITLTENKEYFNDQLSEVKSVTEKTTKFIIGYISLFFAISAFVYAKSKIDCSHYFLFFFSLLDIILAAQIIMGRKGHISGFAVQQIMNKDFDDSKKYKDIEKRRLIYYNILEALKTKTDEIIVLNKERAYMYNWFIILTVILILSAMVKALLTISSYNTVIQF